MKTVLAVDGNSLTHRAYHAFIGRDGKEGRRNERGEAVWAVEGLINFIGVLVEKTRPDFLVVGFDDTKHSVRRTQLPSYKAGRSAKDADLETQLDAAPLALEKLGISVVTPDGLEADDVLAGVRVWSKTRGVRCIIATSDRDSFALIDENTEVLRVINGGPDKAELYSADVLYARYGVHPECYPLYAAIRGDSSDNLPGVDGIGEKGAAKIVSITKDLNALLGELAKDKPFDGQLSAGVIGKISDPVMVERLKLNTSMMQLNAISIKDKDVTALPLPSSKILAALVDVKISGRAQEALSGGANASGQSSAEEAPSNDSWVENPPRERILSGLKAAWSQIEKQAPKPAAVEAGPKTYGAAPKAYHVPNPRPAKSLLSR